LTFRSLGTNGSELSGGYGDRVLTSPKIGVSFTTTPEEPVTAGWKIRQDASWSDGAVYLDAGEGRPIDGSTTFSLRLQADDGYAARIDSFSLLDYVDDEPSGQRVRWEIWNGAMRLRSGIADVPDDSRFDVLTGLPDPISGIVDLKLIPMEGKNGSLGFDDLQFSQHVVPEPHSWFMAFIGLATLGQCMHRRANHGPSL
jgi:hypothetical protein